MGCSSSDAVSVSLPTTLTKRGCALACTAIRGMISLISFPTWPRVRLETRVGWRLRCRSNSHECSTGCPVQFWHLFLLPIRDHFCLENGAVGGQKDVILRVLEQAVDRAPSAQSFGRCGVRKMRSKFTYAMISLIDFFLHSLPFPVGCSSTNWLHD